MTRIELEKHLCERVVVTLFDGDVIVGELHKTGDDFCKDKNDPNICIPKNCYICAAGTEDAHCIFKVSHVKRLEVL